mmetsp:Transcript_34835/g.109386  ORF Transcript_34835/g.109386 Transcript_34835/m.109386 type:complete len:414 (-) Transcript_34835:124-1365(-)
MAESDSGDFEDSNYFERSRDEKAPGGRRLDNQPFDEALDVSASLDMSGAGIPRAGLGAQHKGAGGPREPRQLANDQYDEALDVSASMDVKSFAGGSPTQPPGHGGLAKVEEAEISNNPFDEVHDMSGSDDESIDTTASAKYPGAAVDPNPDSKPNVEPNPIPDPRPNPNPKDAKMSKSSQDAAAAALSGGSTMGGAKASGAMGSMGGQTGGLKAAMSPGSKSSGVASEDESEEESDDEAESSGVIYKNAYKSSDYAHLNVGAEVRELFNYIERYKPHEVELDTTLMCFIPDYIPAVGDMDAFLKVPRPDGVEDDLGLKVLDEPSASQSDPTVLELQLRAISKKVHGDVSVRSIENAHKSPADIERWIKSIQELHRNKPPPRVTYNRSMPEIEPLMEAWPEDFERALSQIAIPP